MNHIITIDGPAGAGKTSVAHLVAQRLGLPYIPSGRLFRAVALLVQQGQIDIDDNESLAALLNPHTFDMRPDGHVIYQGSDITDRLYEPEVGSRSTIIAKNQTIRQHLLDLQRQLGAKGCVIEGRSTAIEIFPAASTKIWLIANEETRIDRKKRAEGERSAGAIVTRDEIDSQRQLAPMQKAIDAVTIDTTDLSLEQVADKIIEVYERAIQYNK